MTPVVRSCARRGFSLIELLVVVAIVTVLVSILLPTLRRARDSSRDVICLSNLRQLTTAWLVYTNDHRAFPLPDNQFYWYRLHNGWGGVHWYSGTDQTPGLQLPAERPVNPYVCNAGQRIETRAAVFRCPRDSGGSLSQSGTRTWESITGQIVESGDASSTCFGVAGTSYSANEWMYCVPQDRGFEYAPPDKPFRNFVGSNGPHSVLISPSRFVVLGDGPASVGARIERSYRLQRDYWCGFWHEEEHGQLGFLDGSARLERMGAVNTGRYTYFMNPARHTLASKFDAHHW